MSALYTVAIAGATGVVGGTVRGILEERGFPVGELRLLASERSQGRKLAFRGEDVTVQTLTAEAFAGVDLAFFAAGGSVSTEFVPKAVAAGAVVDRQVERLPRRPGRAARRARGQPAAPRRPQGDHREAQLLDHPDGRRAEADPRRGRHRARRRLDLPGGLRQRQAGHRRPRPSGARVGRRRRAQPSFYPHPIAFNLLPHIDSFLPSGYTKEEQKMVDETVKIFDDPDLKVTATCVRVPVFGAHSEAVNVQTRLESVRRRGARAAARPRRASRWSTTRRR